MSESGEWFWSGDHTQTNPSKMDATAPEVTPTQDPNSTTENVTLEEEKKVSEPVFEPKGISYSSQEYSDMKDDPSMRYEYTSGRPAAGHPTVQTPHNTDMTHKSRRHYKMADNIFETEPDSTPLDMTTSHRIEPEGISFSSEEYANMKGDPVMSYEYSSGRAAAGHPSHCDPLFTEGSPASRRHYKAADDIVGSTDSTPLDMTTSRGIEPEGVSYSSQEYADMKDDPLMSYEYSSGRAAAGHPSPDARNSTEPFPTGRRHYKMADDTVG